MTGVASSGWPDPARQLDFFDLKGAVEALMASLGIEGWQVGPPPGPLFHPGRSASVTIGEELVGEFGELHPAVGERLDLTGRVGIAELEMAVLARHATGEVAYAELPRFPPVRRDLAFVLPAGVHAAAVHEAIVGAVADLGVEASLFDVHSGPPIPEGHTGLAFGVDLRAPDRTLTDDDAAWAVAAIQAKVAELGGQLRAG
jgi:phenylalanyl-tRNA synthetase beta chain